LVSDIVLPGGMSGRELAQRLVEERPKLRVVFVTGYSAEGMDTAFVRRAGAQVFLKPYSVRSLCEALEACLNPATSA
jgi:FixJ family two-component response regulator